MGTKVDVLFLVNILNFDMQNIYFLVNPVSADMRVYAFGFP